MDIPTFEKTVDPDQLATKSSDQASHSFYSGLKYMLISGMLQVNMIKIWRSVVHK